VDATLSFMKGKCWGSKVHRGTEGQGKTIGELVRERKGKKRGNTIELGKQTE